MHSSGMHTACLLTVSQHALGRVCVCIQHALGMGGCVYPSMHWAGVYPSMHWAEGCISQHALGKGCLPGGVHLGVSLQGCLPRGCLPRRVSAWGHLSGDLPRGCLPGGVYPGAVSAWGVCLWSLGGVLQHAMGQTPPCRQTDTCENITFTNFACGR